MGSHGSRWGLKRIIHGQEPVGGVEKAKKILGDVGWSAAANEFKFAGAVLLKDYREASEMMQTIGLQCGYLDEAGYHTWPLFIEFRETDEFVSTYLEVYGYPYALKVREEADQASRRAAEEAQREPSETTQTLEGSSSVVGNDELNRDGKAPAQRWYPDAGG